jgi:hypothetical protein
VATYDIMINLLDPTPPAPADILSTRSNAKLSQQDAADLIGYSRRGWQDAEGGKTKMHPAAWALFLLATGQHAGWVVVSNPIQFGVGLEADGLATHCTIQLIRN